MGLGLELALQQQQQHASAHNVTVLHVSSGNQCIGKLVDVTIASLASAAPAADTCASEPHDSPEDILDAAVHTHHRQLET